jgi:hypothetical protein
MPVSSVCNASLLASVLFNFHEWFSFQIISG